MEQFFGFVAGVAIGFVIIVPLGFLGAAYVEWIYRRFYK